VLLETQTPTLK